MQTFIKEGEGASKEKKNNVKGGGVKKGNATPSNPATLTLPMCYAVLVMGMFMLNLLVLLMSTLNGLYGFLRPLLLTSKDPLQNGT